MKKLVSIIVAAGMALAAPLAFAETDAAHPKKAVKKPVKKAAKNTPAEPEPDVSTSTASDYQCAQGHKITVYRNATDNQNVAMRWNKRLLAMKRVETESGAERLENEKQGLVFIGIPEKAMLLDTKKGQQLANECKVPGQQ